MKRILLILSLFCLCFTYNNVSAVSYVDMNSYNLYDDWQLFQYSVGGYEPKVKNLFATSDGGFVIIFNYKEDGEIIPGMDANWEPTGTGTPKRDHSKVVKYTKDFKKQWETNLYEVGTWSNPDPLAPTVNTNLLQGTELDDGTFIFTGYHEMGRPNAIYYRVDKDGNLIYKKLYADMGTAEMPTSIKNGGYIIKYFYDGGLKPAEFSISDTAKDIYYYVVYDCANNIVDSFPEGEESRLNNYEFNDQLSKENLIYSGNTIYSKKYPYLSNEAMEEYLFTTSNGDRVYSYASDQRNQIDIKVYDSNGNLKNTILEARAIDKVGVFVDKSYFLFNEGSYMIGNKVFDINGNKIFDNNNINEDYRPDKNESHSFYIDKERGVASTVLCDGTLIRIIYCAPSTGYADGKYPTNYRIEYKKSSPKESEDFANLVIAGEEIIIKNGTIHLENDRTYISISKLCSIVGCQYKRAESDDEILVISFPVFDKKNKFLEGDINYDYKTPLHKYVLENGKYVEVPSDEPYEYLEMGYYVVEHRVESKFYQTYLDLTPYQVFSFKSPTYNADSVDVASKIINGEVYVPLRFVAEALGRYVTYTPGVNGGKPTITISAAGEGEFYEKYGVVVSRDKLFENDTITNIETSSVINLYQKNSKLYGYAIDKNTNSILNTNQTIFFPLAFGPNNSYTSFKDRSSKLKDNSEYYLGTESSTASSGNYFGLLACKQNYLFREGIPIYNSTKEEVPMPFDYPYLVISNINGYPFLKILYIDLEKN